MIQFKSVDYILTLETEYTYSVSRWKGWYEDQ